MNRYTVDVAPGGLECRIIGPDGWEGPWRSTEYHGRLQVVADRRRRRASVFVGRAFSVLVVVASLSWIAALAAAGVWVAVRVMASW
jgi:hypothetical protein